MERFNERRIDCRIKDEIMRQCKYDGIFLFNTVVFEYISNKIQKNIPNFAQKL